jgi:hypothetical protein
MAVFENPNVFNNSLILYFDIANSFSYIGTGLALNDISPINNSATLNSHVLVSNYNNLGVLSFNGVNAFVTGGNFQVISAGQPVTVNSWVYFNGLNTSNIFNCHVGVTTLFSVVQKLGGLYARNNAGDYNLNTSIYSPGWINICVAFSNLGATSYINGNYVFTNVGAATSGNAGISTFAIGHNGLNTNLEPLNGLIGLLSVYNAALSTSQALQNFNAFRSRFGL